MSDANAAGSAAASGHVEVGFGCSKNVAWVPVLPTGFSIPVLVATIRKCLDLNSDSYTLVVCHPGTRTPLRGTHVVHPGDAVSVFRHYVPCPVTARQPLRGVDAAAAADDDMDAAAVVATDAPAVVVPPPSHLAPVGSISLHLEVTFVHACLAAVAYTVRDPFFPGADAARTRVFRLEFTAPPCLATVECCALARVLRLAYSRAGRPGGPHPAPVAVHVYVPSLLLCNLIRVTSRGRRVVLHTRAAGHPRAVRDAHAAAAVHDCVAAIFECRGKVIATPTGDRTLRHQAMSTVRNMVARDRRADAKNTNHV